jgi:DDE superfamily endonuclease
MGVFTQPRKDIMPFLSPAILANLSPFAILFSRPVWKHALTLVMGTILCRGKRTVCAALRMMGLSDEVNFTKYHHVLNRVEWSLLSAAQILLNLIVNVIGNENPLVFFIDETLERRRGPKIKAKGYYRDAVRSSKNIVVKSSGLKWLTLAISWRFPFSARHFALPFMTVLEPSAKSDKAANRRHKTTLQWTIQMLIQVVRWLKNTPIILVGDGGFACGELAWRCLKLKICLITRLKMNARLYDFPPLDTPGKRGRKKTKGAKLFSFKEMIGMPDLGWTEIIVEGYGKKKKKLKYISNTSLWGVDSFRPVPIRWVLVIDPEGELDSLPLMSTNLNISPEKIIGFYIQRWNLEVTFEEVREHLGVETQRQWSDKAIARTTPILMGLYTIVCLIANRLQEEHPIEVAQTAWYEKKDAAFSDLLKAVRKILWKDNLIFRKHILESFHENNKGLDEVIGTADHKIPPEISWIRLLIEHLSAA